MWVFYTCTTQELITGHVHTAVSVLAKATTPAVTEVLNKINMMQKIKGGQEQERWGDDLACQDTRFRNA